MGVLQGSFRSNVLVALCVLLSLVDRSSQGWINNFDQHFRFQCPDGQSVTAIASYHHNHYEDRRFGMACGVLPHSLTPIGCNWSDFVNNFDSNVNYQCPGAGYIAGMESYHNNHNEDRRYKFYCCGVSGTVTTQCSVTNDVNAWDEPFFHAVPVGRVLTGMLSRHDNHREDRLFKLTTCAFVKH